MRKNNLWYLVQQVNCIIILIISIKISAIKQQEKSFKKNTSFSIRFVNEIIKKFNENINKQYELDEKIK